MPTFLEADRSVLISLGSWHDRHEKRGGFEWARPMDLGGRASSGHSQALARLVKLGLAERRERTDTGRYIVSPSRASFEYRITAAGLDRGRQGDGRSPPAIAAVTAR
jgi:hypothetical protein